MEETTASSDKNVYTGKVVAEKEKETVYSDTETKENQYSSDEKDETEAKQATEIDVPKKPAPQAKEKVGFSDNEVDENNHFHRSFIGVPTLLKGSIRLNKKLGEGAFGEVYQGTWGKENRPVALKKIDLNHAKKNFGHLTNAQILESLQWEVTRLSTVSHPNCVQFYGIYQHKVNARTYVVMEFCEGGTLEKALEQNPSWQKRWQWALEMSQGLAYLHDQGIVHRDLKAENILLNKSGCAQLADLGVAQVDALLQGRTATVVEQGLQDQRFIAPENADKDMKDSISNKATDIYALGLVFWQLACSDSQAPKSPNDIEMSGLYYWKRGYYKDGKVFEREPIPANCPPAFKQLILDCWARDPEKRPDAKTVVAQLQVMDLSPQENHPEKSILQTCEQLEQVIHAKRLEGLHYVAPYVTEYEVLESIESYWSRFENIEDKEASKGNPPLELMPRLEGFLENSHCNVLVLLGDSGLGKSLSTYLFADQQLKKCWAYLNAPEAKNTGKPPYLPLFIRSAVEEKEKWSYSALEGGFEKAKAYYHLEKTSLPLLLVLDGYDECGADKIPANLPQALGLPPNMVIKLIVTCRTNTVEKNELCYRFSFKHDEDYQINYFLPFSLKQMFDYVTEQLSWDEKTRKAYMKKLTRIESLKSVLRNPFVLQLFVHCFENIPQKNLDNLKRWQIYEVAVEHWLDNDKELLSPFVQQDLQDEYASLAESFQYFAGQLAFTAFQQKTLSLPKEAIASLNSAWGNFLNLITEDAHTTFHYTGIEITLFTTSDKDLLDVEKLRLRSDISLPCLIQFQTDKQTSFYVYGQNKKGKVCVRELSLPPEPLHTLPWTSAHKVRLFQDNYREIYHAIIEQDLHVKSGKRSVLSEQDFVKIRETQGQHCMANSPLKPRLSGMEFTHKSFFEYFVARHLLALSRLPLEEIQYEARELLADRNLTTEPEILAFWMEGWECSGTKETNRLIAPLFAMIASSKNCPEQAQSASNAATLLAKVKVPFVNKDLQAVHIPEADLSEAVFSLSNFSQANLRRVNFRAACLTGVNFTDADMTDVRFGEWASLKGTDEVYSICYSLHGNYLAIAEGCNIGIFEKNDGEYERIHTLVGHTNCVRSVAYSPDGSQLASGSDDNTVRQWAVKSGKAIQILAGHTKPVKSVAYSPDGSQLASGSQDKTMRQWDVKSGKEIHIFKGHLSAVNCVAYSPDGNQLASGSYDKTVRQWDVKSGKVIHILMEHTSEVRSVAYSPDGSQLASAGGYLEGTVHQWDTKSGKVIQTLTLTGDISEVMSIAYSPDGRQLASGSVDKIVRQWDVKSGKEIHALTGHTDSVMSVAYSPDGNQLASGSVDKTVWQWDVKSGKKTHSLKGHMSEVTSVAYSPDGSQLASGSGDHTVQQWDAKSGKTIQILKKHTSEVKSVAYSPDSGYLASGSVDKTVRQWDVKSGKNIHTFKEHTSEIRSVVYSPDGSQLASGSVDKTVWQWDVKSGKAIQMLKGHPFYVMSVAYSSDGNQLASGSQDTVVRQWDAKSGKMIQMLMGHTREVTSVAYSPDGNQLASGSGDHTVRQWDVKSGKAIQVLRGHTREVTSVAYSPDGSQLASGSVDKSVWQWDVKSGKMIYTLRGHIHEVTSVAYSPDGNQLASGSRDSAIFIWQRVKTTLQAELWVIQYRLSRDCVLLAQEAVLHNAVISKSTVKLLQQRGTQSNPDYTKINVNLLQLQQHEIPLEAGIDISETVFSLSNFSQTNLKGRGMIRSICYSPRGHYLAMAEGCNIVIIEKSDGEYERIKTLMEHTDSVISVAYSPDGNQLASGSFDKTVRQWDVKSGKVIQMLTGHTDSVVSVAYSPDGSQLISGSFDRTVRQWDVKSGKMIQTFKGHTSAVRSVAYSPDGSQLASGGYDNTVRRWDVKSKKLIQTLKGHASAVISVAYSPDGSQLASGSFDTTVRQWDVKSGKEIHTLTGHTDSVISVAYSSDGSQLASGSKDATVRQWDVESGRMIQAFKGHTFAVRSVAYSPDGSQLASGSFNSAVLRQCDVGNPIHTLKEHTLHYSERSTRLFCSFFNTRSAFFKNGERIAVYLNPRHRQAMACVSQSTYKFFQTIPPPRPLISYENKPAFKEPTIQATLPRKKHIEKTHEKNCLVM